jgi:Putative prokaryotic signal transducing protein
METANEHEAPELVTIRQFGDMAEALLAEGCLESAGIGAFLIDANVARIDWPLTRGMRLQVSAEDAEAANEVLTHSGDAAATSSDNDA